ncbi:hypothetical protein [Chitinophaga defluvii]|uniref:Uncharacterized protein n=1 Tax=Chitinophaga defluvii TaxID=3163343 RepID=A0ABV2T867_9BACT
MKRISITMMALLLGVVSVLFSTKSLAWKAKRLTETTYWYKARPNTSPSSVVESNFYATPLSTVSPWYNYSPQSAGVCSVLTHLVCAAVITDHGSGYRTMTTQGGGPILAYGGFQ